MERVCNVQGPLRMWEREDGGHTAGSRSLRMHCCDSYHWLKAPREIYDETRTHNIKGTGGEVIGLVVPKIKNMGWVWWFASHHGEKFWPKNDWTALFSSLCQSAGCEWWMIHVGLLGQLTMGGTLHAWHHIPVPTLQWWSSSSSQLLS